MVSGGGVGVLMIFTIRQLTEKAVEHWEKQYLVFVDLKKAYDSVPHEALWVALRKLGIPDHLIDIRSFHDNMKAKLWVDGDVWGRLKWRMVCGKVALWRPYCSICMLV